MGNHTRREVAPPKDNMMTLEERGEGRERIAKACWKKKDYEKREGALGRGKMGTKEKPKYYHSQHRKTRRGRGSVQTAIIRQKNASALVYREAAKEREH